MTYPAVNLNFEVVDARYKTFQLFSQDCYLLSQGCVLLSQLVHFMVPCRLDLPRLGAIMQGIASWPEKPLLFLLYLSARIVRVHCSHLLFELGHLITFLWPMPVLVHLMLLYSLPDLMRCIVSVAHPIMNNAILKIFVCLPTAEVASAWAAIVTSTSTFTAENVPIGREEVAHDPA